MKFNYKGRGFVVLTLSAMLVVVGTVNYQLSRKSLLETSKEFAAYEQAQNAARIYDIGFDYFYCTGNASALHRSGQIPSDGRSDYSCYCHLFADVYLGEKYERKNIIRRVQRKSKDYK